MCFKKKKILIAHIYYCVHCKHYFKTSKKYEEHKIKYHKFDYLNTI